MSNTIYTHFESNKFELSRFEKIRNNDHGRLPFGGLWATPEDSDNNWVNWCSRNINICDYTNSFSFRLSADAIVISADLALHKMPTHNGYINFEALSAIGVDAIKYHAPEAGQEDSCASFWDCDNILILNPNVVEVLDLDSAQEFDDAAALVLLKRQVCEEFNEFKEETLKFNSAMVFYMSDEIQRRKDFVQEVQLLHSLPRTPLCRLLLSHSLEPLTSGV